jgi:hypothetical protein
MSLTMHMTKAGECAPAHMGNDQRHSLRTPFETSKIWFIVLLSIIKGVGELAEFEPVENTASVNDATVPISTKPRRCSVRALRLT